MGHSKYTIILIPDNTITQVKIFILKAYPGAGEASVAQSAYTAFSKDPDSILVTQHNTVQVLSNMFSLAHACKLCI